MKNVKINDEEEPQGDVDIEKFKKNMDRKMKFKTLGKSQYARKTLWLANITNNEVKE